MEIRLQTPINAKSRSAICLWQLAVGLFVTRAMVVVAVVLLVYGLVWNFSQRRYLKGLADAIIPLEGSSEERTEALLWWFRHEPQRLVLSIQGAENLRDPVIIVQNERLLKMCGSASNAFINLGDAVGLKTRRLLLLGPSGTAKHVVAEVQWGDRWVVVDPQLGRVFRDRSGRGLSKGELRDPEVFKDAISRMPSYLPDCTFDHAVHIRWERIPVVGRSLRSALNRHSPGWAEAIDWAYLAENPSMWPILISIPLLLLAFFLHFILDRHYRRTLEIERVRLRERLANATRVFLTGAT